MGEAGRVVAYLKDWLSRNSVGSTITFRALKSAVGVDSKTFKDTVQKNEGYKAWLIQVGLVEYVAEPGKSKYRQGYQLTADVGHTQEQLFDERHSANAIYGFSEAA